MPLHVSSTCAHHKEVKIALHSLWYHHNYRCIGTSWSCSQAVSKPVWHAPLLCLQWKTPDDGQRNCPKHVDFYSKNKFEKLVHLVGFVIRTQNNGRTKKDVGFILPIYNKFGLQTCQWLDCDKSYFVLFSYLIWQRHIRSGFYQCYLLQEVQINI